MSAARNGHVSPATAAGGVRARSRTGAPTRAAAARADLSELRRLVRILEQHVAVEQTDLQRDLELLGDPTAVAHAEPRLRALTALLVTLSTYQQATAARRAAARRAPPAGPTAVRQRRPAAQRNGTSTNGAQVTGAPGPINGHGGANGGPSVNGRTTGAHHDNGGYSNGVAVVPPALVQAAATDTELAAACARYIARDLAARQLTEFTSAEGYRLARALARLGGVEEPVERLLAEANQVRLHPMPLADAVSHSPH